MPKGNDIKTQKPDKTAEKKPASKGKRLKLIILFGVLIYAGITLINQQVILSSQKEKQLALENQRDELLSEQDYYNNELNYVGSDTYIIKEARERLGWLFPGETKYVEADESNENAVDMAEPTPEPTIAPSTAPSPSASQSAQPSQSTQPSPSASASAAPSQSSGTDADLFNTGSGSDDSLAPLDEPNQ